MANVPATPAAVAPKPEETKDAKFKRLAVSRTAKALDAIANIGGLSNKTNYEYTTDQVAKIFAALEGEMTKLQARFKNPDVKVEGGFSLD